MAPNPKLITDPLPGLETTESGEGSTSPVVAGGRVPLFQKIFYGLGGPVEGTAVWVPQANLIPVFNVAYGMNPTYLGMVIMLWRCWDGFADLIMGNISDNARTRWGRRRPFIVLGAVLTGLVIPIMWWMPAGLSQWASLGWLLISGIILYSCFTIWAMPYYSLQLEMSSDYDERTNITAYRAFFQQIFSLITNTGATGWILALAALPVLSRLPGHKPDLANGMRYISLFIGLLTIALGVLPGLFVKERFYEKETSEQSKIKLLDSLKQTLSTRPFLWIIAIVFTQTFGFSIVGALGFYLNAYYVCQGNILLATKISGVIAMVLFVPSVLAIPFCTWVSNRWGKQTLLLTIIACGITGCLSMYIFVTPAHPWLQIIPALLSGPITVGIWLVVPSMQADVADYDELTTGKRREGSFSAVFSWTFKASMALAGGLGGAVLALTGFEISKGAQQAPNVLSNLKLFSIWIPITFLCFCFFAISRYSLSKERMHEIRKELELRRGVI
jgi:GPH family glycoside/pentoside/hexuronide:cation symporter